MIVRTELKTGGKTVRLLGLEKDGFCFGVRRAVDSTLEAAENKRNNVFTLGEIVHNPEVVKKLSCRGVETIDDVTETPADSVVIIRSHGVPPEVIEEIEDRGAEVVDATCPRVCRVQQAAEKHREDGRHIVIVGYEDHPEVRGVFARSGSDAIIVESLEDVLNLDLPDKGVVVLFQTTFNPQKGQRIVEAIQKETGDDLIVEDTLCHVVSQRRREVTQLTEEADFLVVVGGKNSSNTSSLMEISHRAGIPAVHVEKADNLLPEYILNKDSIAVVGGTSTPEESIEAVKDSIHGIIRQSTGD